MTLTKAASSGRLIFCQENISAGRAATADRIVAPDMAGCLKPRRRSRSLLMPREGRLIDENLFDAPHKRIIRLRHLERDTARFGSRQGDMVGKMARDDGDILHRVASEKALKPDRPCSVRHPTLPNLLSAPIEKDGRAASDRMTLPPDRGGACSSIFWLTSFSIEGITLAILVDQRITLAVRQDLVAGRFSADRTGRG
jgi:hypothetical protein